MPFLDMGIAFERNKVMLVWVLWTSPDTVLSICAVGKSTFIFPKGEKVPLICYLFQKLYCILYNTWCQYVFHMFNHVTMCTCNMPSSKLYNCTIWNFIQIHKSFYAKLSRWLGKKCQWLFHITMHVLYCRYILGRLSDGNVKCCHLIAAGEVVWGWSSWWVGVWWWVVRW